MLAHSFIPIFDRKAILDSLYLLSFNFLSYHLLSVQLSSLLSSKSVFCCLFRSIFLVTKVLFTFYGLDRRWDSKGCPSPWVASFPLWCVAICFRFYALLDGHILNVLETSRPNLHSYWIFNFVCSPRHKQQKNTQFCCSGGYANMTKTWVTPSWVETTTLGMFEKKCQFISITDFWPEKQDSSLFFCL